MRVAGLVWIAVGVAGAQTFYDVQKEAALGKQLAEEFRRTNPPIDSAAVQQYVDRLGQRLAAQMPDARTPFTFAVVSGDTCRWAAREAAGLPGGYVFVPAPLLLEARDEAALAVVVAHAMAHVVTRVPKVGAGGVPLIFVGGWGTGCLDARAVPFANPQKIKAEEQAADVLAAGTVARAGFGADATRESASQELADIQREVRRLTEQPARRAPSLYRK